METENFNELAGRIEGLGRMLMLLVYEVAEEGAIDRHDFISRLRQVADALDAQAGPLLPAAKRTMHEGADYLEKRRA